MTVLYGGPVIDPHHHLWDLSLGRHPWLRPPEREEREMVFGSLAPIRRDLLTNWGNLSPIFLDPPFDPGNAHSVPYLWGMTGVA